MEMIKHREVIPELTNLKKNFCSRLDLRRGMTATHTRHVPRALLLWTPCASIHGEAIPENSRAHSSHMPSQTVRVNNSQMHFLLAPSFFHSSTSQRVFENSLFVFPLKALSFARDLPDMILSLIHI